MVAVELSKIVVVTINIIFLIFGLAALIVGIIFKVGWDEVRDAFVNLAKDADFDLQSAGDALGYAGIIFGSFIIVVSLLGCIGACCRVRVLLVLYAIILIILIIGECALVGVIATRASETEDTIAKGLDETLKGYNENGTGDQSTSYSALFNKFECCGIQNYSISFPFNQTAHRNTGFNADSPHRRNASIQNDYIPITCCKTYNYKDKLTTQSFLDSKDCLNNPEGSGKAYTTGCLVKVIDIIKDHKGILIGVGVAILVLELLMVLLAFCICCSGDKDGVHV